MEGPNTRTLPDRAGQFREYLAIPLDSAVIGDAAISLFIGPDQIAASALCDFDDRVVVLP